MAKVHHERHWVVLLGEKPRGPEMNRPKDATPAVARVPAHPPFHSLLLCLGMQSLFLLPRFLLLLLV